jgi:hypothetical protein
MIRPQTMGARILRRAALIAGVFVTCLPVFSRADTGERDDPDAAERPENELRIEATPSTGYGRYAICDSLSRVRYGGLGAAARNRHDTLAAKVGGSVSAVRQHTTDTDAADEDRQPPSQRSHAVVDGVAQVGLDTHYVAVMGGVAVMSALRAADDDDDDDGAGVFPSAALRLGSYRGLSLRLSLADTEPVGLALAAAELVYQHQNKVRAGLGARLDAFTLNGLPMARVELPVGPHWLGLTTGAAPSEGAIAWQLQLMLDFQVLASSPQ